MQAGPVGLCEKAAASPALTHQKALASWNSPEGTDLLELLNAAPDEREGRTTESLTENLRTKQPGLAP